MGTANVYGYVTGRFSLLEYTNTVSLPISTYNSQIYAVLRLNGTQTEFVTYKPESNNNPFTHFQPNNSYLIFGKQNFSVQVGNESSDKLLVTGSAPDGKYTLAYYPFTESTPFSSYNSSLLEIKATNFLSLLSSEQSSISASAAAIDGALLQSYIPTRPINSATKFEKGQVYLIKATSGFIIYNPDVDALLQEDTGQILLENNSYDRLVLE